MGAADHDRMAMGAGQLDQRGEQRSRRFDEQIGRVAQHPAPRRVDHIARREAVVNPRTLGRTDACLHHIDEGSDIVVMSRPADDAKDVMPHIVLNVTDMAATVKALKAAGGTMEREPFEFGKTGIFIGMAIDPAGNHVELIQQPKAAPAPAKK
jgi:hypothetical protein